MPVEARELLRLVGAYQRERARGLPSYRFELSSCDCRLVLCGIGLARARAAAAALIAAERPDLVVSFGIGGGVGKDLEVGDVVIGGSVTLLKGDVATRPIALAQLPAPACRAVGRALRERGAALYEGSVVTTAGSQALRAPADSLAHPVLDMETHGVAQEASARGVPLLALRALSDSIREPLPFDLGDFTDADCNLHSARLLAYVVLHPRVVALLPRLQRNTRRAAGNAALAVLTALGHIDNAEGHPHNDPHR